MPALRVMFIVIDYCEGYCYYCVAVRSENVEES